jgi:hypothetical protein
MLNYFGFIYSDSRSQRKSKVVKCFNGATGVWSGSIGAGGGYITYISTLLLSLNQGCSKWFQFVLSSFSQVFRLINLLVVLCQ